MIDSLALCVRPFILFISRILREPNMLLDVGQACGLAEGIGIESTSYILSLWANTECGER